MIIKKILKAIAPPVVVDVYRFLRWGQRWNEFWDGVYPSFREVPKSGRGFGEAVCAKANINRTKAAILAAREDGDIPMKVVGEEAFLPMLASVVADSKGGRLRILDFGGGAGISFVHLTSGMPQGTKLDYHIVELEWACEAGRQLFAGDDRIRFHEALPATLQHVDIVFTKGALMYVEDYAGLLKQLCRYRARFLFMVSLAAGDFPTFASSQRNLPGTVVAHWFFNLDEIVRIMSDEGYTLVFTCAMTEQLRQGSFPESHRLRQGRVRSLLFALRTGDAPVQTSTGRAD